MCGGVGVEGLKLGVPGFVFGVSGDRCRIERVLGLGLNPKPLG